ncbi:MAG: biotin/lipoyl-containing protein, partial [Gemmataceae bacterium]
MDFRLPALGEGIDSATVVGVLVQPGETVSAGQNVLTVETDKAAVEVPIDVAGTVAKILVKPGDKIPVGTAILHLGNTVSAAAPQPAPPVAKPTSPPAPVPAAAPAPSPSSGPVDFALPALGEGIEVATVVGLLVKVGDTVTVGQNVAAVETDKAAVEVPSEIAGTVLAIHVKPGDKIPVGTKLFSLSGSTASAPAAAIARTPSATATVTTAVAAVSPVPAPA